MLDFAHTPEANPNPNADMVEGYGVRFVKGNGLEEEATVNQDVARISWEDGTKEETLSLDTESVLKGRTEVPEVVRDMGYMSDLADKTQRMKVKKEMSAEEQDKAISTVGTKIYKSGAGEAVKSMRKADCQADVDGSIDKGSEETEDEGMEEGDDSQHKEDEKKEAEEPPKTQPAETHNQLGVAQGRNALNGKTTESSNLTIKKTKNMKKADNPQNI
jgi:hypothetical protein